MHSIQEISQEINSRAKDYKVGGLQQIRKENGGLKRLPSRDLFAYRQVHKDWVSHLGGRKELQFNMGRDGDYLRCGVAFSLESSQSLPSIEVLIPKIKLFNEYLNENSVQFSDLRMWHYQADLRSPDYMPSSIPYELVQEGVFIFMGQRQPFFADIDYSAILTTLDRLLPLFLYTESASDLLETNPISKSFTFTSGCTEKMSNTSGTIAEKELNIRLKHNDLQMELYNQLVELYGEKNVGSEIRTNNGSIDIVVERSGEFWFYEIKTASTARACMRQALGQIMEYAFWPKNKNAEKIIIAGEPKATPTEKKYLEVLKMKFGLPIDYQSIKI